MKVGQEIHCVPPLRFPTVLEHAVGLTKGIKAEDEDIKRKEIDIMTSIKRKEIDTMTSIKAGDEDITLAKLKIAA